MIWITRQVQRRTAAAVSICFQSARTCIYNPWFIQCRFDIWVCYLLCESCVPRVNFTYRNTHVVSSKHNDSLGEKAKESRVRDTIAMIWTVEFCNKGVVRALFYFYPQAWEILKVSRLCWCPYGNILNLGLFRCWIENTSYSKICAS